MLTHFLNQTPSGGDPISNYGECVLATWIRLITSNSTCSTDILSGVLQHRLGNQEKHSIQSGDKPDTI
jgi:hypothetical protein